MSEIKTSRMDKTWAGIEEHFPPAGVRPLMFALLRARPLAAFERAKVVTTGPIAERFPCTSPCPERCPRLVFENENGTYTAFCPQDAEDIILLDDDVRMLSFDKDAFVAELRRLMGIKGRFEWLPGLPDVCRIGALVPEPGTTFPILFVARCSPADYAAVFDVLLAQARGTPFAALVPTRRHISHDTERRLADAGALLVALADVMGVFSMSMEDHLALLVEQGRLFERLGQVPTTREGKAPVVARAIVGRAGKSSWRDLDQDAYDRLLAQHAEYDVMADELTKSCFRKGKTKRGINPAYFLTYRAALERRSKYDPVEDGPEDRVAAQQTFQRARQTFDVGKRKTWKIVKTDESETPTRYNFEPDADVSFVFIFAPSK